MMHDNKNDPRLFKNLKYDLPAGIVVFLVAVPLCLGIALASGAPLFSGLITGIVGGMVTTLLSRSPLSVSGPAAGLTAIVLSAIESLDGYESFLLAVVIAGLLQIVLGYAKAGVIGYYFPNSVIKGMLAGIGLILVLKQIPHAFGYDADYEGDMSFFQPDGETTFSELFKIFDFFAPGAIIISFISLAVLILWDYMAKKDSSFFKLIPGPLFVVVMGVFLNELFRIVAPGLALGVSHLVSIPVAGSAGEFIDQFSMPDFTAWRNYNVYLVAATIAIVASLETLLSVEAVDKLDPYKRTSPTNRELKAQGVGNMISGLIGGLPMTAVIVRSSTNVNFGGKTKMSAFIHGFLILLSVILLPKVLNMIPLASLAAILLLVGYKLAKVSLFKSMYRAGLDQFLPFVVTITAILLSDLLKGIAIGMAVAIYFILRNNYKKPYYFEKEKHKEGDKITIKLAEEVTFLNKASIQLTLEHIPENSHVVVDGSNSGRIDYDVLEILENYKETARGRNIKYEIKGIASLKKTAVS